MVDLKPLKLQIAELKKSIDNPLLIIYRADEELIGRDLEIICGLIGNYEFDSGSLILSGGGGHFDSSIDLGVFLGQKFSRKLSTYVPSQASSALAYVILLSNEAYCCNSEPLSQFDLTFIKDGEVYRAREQLSNPDKRINDDAKLLWRTTSDILKNILVRKDSISQQTPVTNDYLTKVMDLCMRKNQHKSSIRLSELKKLNFQINLIQDQVLKNILLRIYVSSIAILEKENSRFLVGNEQTIIISS